MERDKVNLAEKFALINKAWHPHIVGELNGQEVKLAKFKGDFPWHKHEHEDDMFLVIEGEIKIALESKTINLKAGEFYIVPKNTMHAPSATKEASVLLFEPQSTKNTGDLQNEFTREHLPRI